MPFCALRFTYPSPPNDFPCSNKSWSCNYCIIITAPSCLGKKTFILLFHHFHLLTFGCWTVDPKLHYFFVFFCFFPLVIMWLGKMIDKFVKSSLLETLRCGTDIMLFKRLTKLFILIYVWAEFLLVKKYQVTNKINTFDIFN